MEVCLCVCVCVFMCVSVCPFHITPSDTLSYSALKCDWYKRILFRNGELSLPWPGVAARCWQGRGMGGQDGLRADADEGRS